MMHKTPPKIAVIGFGEAGSSLCEGWNKSGIRVYDIKLDYQGKIAEQMAERMDLANVIRAHDTFTAVSNADAIFSTVTADQAKKVAKTAAKSIKMGALYFDLNSCAPSTKQLSAEIISKAGARFVDVAVMASISSKLHRTDMLVSGEHSKEAIQFMESLGMKPGHILGDVGRASTIKMVRSILVKGIEALTAECFAAACKAGVADEVAASLDASHTTTNWKNQAGYNMERMTTHGTRRAAEMREVAQTLSDLNVVNRMTNGTIEWQDEMGDLGVNLIDVAEFEMRFKKIEAATSKKNSCK